MMQCMAGLLILWRGLQCAYLVLDARHASELALEQMYMKNVDCCALCCVEMTHW